MRKESRWGRPRPAGLKDHSDPAEESVGCTQDAFGVCLFFFKPIPFLKKMQQGAIKEVIKVTSLKIFYTTVPFLVGANENVAGRPQPMRTPYFCDVIGTAYRFPLRPTNSLQIPG